MPGLRLTLTDPVPDVRATAAEAVGKMLDKNECLRDTALKAGKKIIQLFADTAITLLLPKLDQGLLD